MPDNISAKENFINERPQSNLQRVGMDAFGVGLFGVGRHSSHDRTKNAWVRATATVTALLVGLLIGSAMSAYAADTFTTNLNLRKPDVNVIDPVTPWGDKLNNNSDILDLAVCDKRTGCTISGPLVIVGPVTAESFTSTSTTTPVGFGDILFQLSKTNAEIQALVCANGKGKCFVLSTDNADIYVSTGTLAGQYQNSRTGTGP